jgi:hypothetical protein
VSDCMPVCPLHKKSMVRVELKPDAHYRCNRYECPIHWDPTTNLYYLKKQTDLYSQESAN